MTYQINCVYNQFTDRRTCSDYQRYHLLEMTYLRRKMTRPISENNLLHLSKGERKLNNKTPHPPTKASAVQPMATKKS